MRPDQTAHELNIATLFLEHLVNNEGVLATGLRSGDAAASEPDCVYVVEGHARGFELVDCWRSGQDAKTVWEMGRAALQGGVRAHFVASSSDLPELDRLVPHPSGNELVAIAEQRMGETWKAYGIPTSLVLNASQTIAPLEDARSGPWLVRQIRKPAPVAVRAAARTCLTSDVVIDSILHHAKNDTEPRRIRPT